MPSDSEQGALRDILHHIQLAQDYTQGLTFEAFSADTMRLYAVTRCLEIISEASRRLSDTLKARNPNIAEKDMAGAGNIYRHEYEDMVAHRVWDTVQTALPPLKSVVDRELGSA
jgi:uncharacterized protein with HEPN domain